MGLFRLNKTNPEVEPVAVELTSETKEEIMSLLGEIHVVSEILDELLHRANQIALAVKVDLKEHIQVVPDGLPPEPQSPPSKTYIPPEHRIRDTPFTRRPISEQTAWVMKILADGQWHTAYDIAKEYATDERHFRYLKGALTNRMGELYREGKLERGNSNTRGSMYTYRIRKS